VVRGRLIKDADVIGAPIDTVVNHTFGREVLPSGSTAAFGISVRQQLGILSNDDGGD
jgi:hypothetical protein